MTTRTVACLLAIAVAIAALSAAASAHEGDPRFRSEVRSITPETEGLEAWVMDFDDNLVVRNQSDEDVLVGGYEGEPFLRFEAAGTVWANERSPTYERLREDFAGAASANAAADVQFVHEPGQEAEPPAEREASPSAETPPEWTEVGDAGRHDWHDDRVRWTEEAEVPPQVTDTSERTEVFDWEVPIRVGDREGAIAGTLTWVGDDDGLPLAAIISLAVLAVLGAVLVVIVRRRRGHGA